MTSARRPLDHAITEAEWMQTVIDLAIHLGWFHYHTYNSRRSQPGFPDLCLVRDRVIFAELKRERGRLSTHQECWQHILHAAGAECYVWRPSDYAAVERILQSRLP